MMTLLLENVTAFNETWIECLGDLARYCMAVEESDMRDREVWAGVSRYWYNQDADRSPDVGRIQHHLAVLARPDVLLQLFHYIKALASVRPFPNARESVVLLFSPYNGQERAGPYVNLDQVALSLTKIWAFSQPLIYVSSLNGLKFNHELLISSAPQQES
jgi:hypothetical protein